MSPGFSRRKRTFDPSSSEPFRISRSKIDLFVECPRCFYLDQRLDVKRPQSYPLTLNIAVDELMKKEFDVLRKSQNPHPVMTKYHIDAVPLQHEDLEKWRDAMRRGIEFLDPRTNLSVRGGVDDVWVSPKGELIVVDYKAKATREEITLDGDLGAQYKRQIEVYQWLFRKNGFTVSPTAYFVFVNGNKDAEKFDGRLEFDTLIVPCVGDDSWVDDTIVKIAECLRDERVPLPSERCEYCAYREKAGKILLENQRKSKPKPEPSKAPRKEAQSTTLF